MFGQVAKSKPHPSEGGPEQEPEKPIAGLEGAVDNSYGSAIAVQGNVEISGINAVIEPEKSFRLKLFKENG